MNWLRARRRGGFIEQTIDALHAAMESAMYAENTARASGFLQRMDPRVKVAGLFAFILVAARETRLWKMAAILLLAVVLAAGSRISIRVLAARVWLGTFPFAAAIALPALFLTPGEVIWRMPGIHWPVTSQGLTSAARLILRVDAAATLAMLVVFTTPWMHVLKALRAFRVPVVLVVILGMTCRYILLLLETAHEMFESRKSRTVGEMTDAERRRMAISSVGVLLGRTLQLSGDVYLAMQARGFRGEVYVLDDFDMKAWDWVALLSFLSLAGVAVWLGR